jgi:hypothetical protein
LRAPRLRTSAMRKPRVSCVMSSSVAGRAAFLRVPRWTVGPALCMRQLRAMRARDREDASRRGVSARERRVDPGVARGELKEPIELLPFTSPTRRLIVWAPALTLAERPETTNSSLVEPGKNVLPERSGNASSLPGTG